MRRAIQVVAEALTEETALEVTKLEIREGWGEVVHIELHSSESSTPATMESWKRIQSGVERGLDGQRHRVQMHWKYPRVL